MVRANDHPQILRLSRNDGQRIRLPLLLLRGRLQPRHLHLHVPNPAGVAVPHLRPGRVGYVRVQDGEDGRVGGDSFGDCAGVSAAYLGGVEVEELGEVEVEEVGLGVGVEEQGWLRGFLKIGSPTGNWLEALARRLLLGFRAGGAAGLEELDG